jgi:hypothetical protein
MASDIQRIIKSAKYGVKPSATCAHVLAVSALLDTFGSEGTPGYIRQ